MTELAGIFKALGDETRLKVVDMVQEQELCVCKIIDEFEVSQSTISHHLKILRQSGVLVATRSGKWVRYRINPEALKKVEEFARKLTAIEK